MDDTFASLNEVLEAYFGSNQFLSDLEVDSDAWRTLSKLAREFIVEDDVEAKYIKAYQILRYAFVELLNSSSFGEPSHEGVLQYAEALKKSESPGRSLPVYQRDQYIHSVSSDIVLRNIFQIPDPHLAAA